MPILRNIAHDVPFLMINSISGAGLTGASVTGYKVIDGGSQVPVDGSVVEKGNGQYLFEGTADDFDAEFSVGFLFTATGGIPVHVLMQMQYFQRNTAYDIPFLMVDSSLGTPKTGLSPTGYRVLDGGTQNSVSGNFIERGNGQYVFQASAADFTASDIIGFVISAAGAVPLHLVIDLKEQYVATQQLSDSPASIVAQYLIDQGIMTLPTAGSNWPVYVSHLPDGDDVKDNAGAIYNTTPVLDGRLMVGTTIQHYGVNIQVRVEDEETGWDKCTAIMAALDAIHNTSVVRNSTSYLLVNVSQTSGINPLGLEAGTIRRYRFTMNYIVTMKQGT